MSQSTFAQLSTRRKNEANILPMRNRGSKTKSGPTDSLTHKIKKTNFNKQKGKTIEHYQLLTIIITISHPLKKNPMNLYLLVNKENTPKKKTPKS